MTAELRPLGVSCNLQCQYCYQNPQCDAGNLLRSYDIDRMKEAIRAEGGPFSPFGGESLMIPIEDLDALWSWAWLSTAATPYRPTARSYPIGTSSSSRRTRSR
jgi:uncharacterized protein